MVSFFYSKVAAILEIVPICGKFFAYSSIITCKPKQPSRELVDGLHNLNILTWDHMLLADLFLFRHKFLIGSLCQLSKRHLSVSNFLLLPDYRT